MNTIDITREAFSTPQVAEITGVPAHSVRHWDRTGLVKPSVRPARGRGSRRLYSYRDLLALATARTLRESKVSLQRVRKCVRFLRRKLPDLSQPLGFCTLLTEGETIHLLTDENELIDTVSHPGQHALLQLSIAAIDHELRQRVVQFSAKRVVEVSVDEFTYQVVVTPDTGDGGYTAEVAGLPGCITDGETIDGVVNMAADAIRCWLEAHDDMKASGAAPPKIGRRRRKAAG
jgi:DNA-binding transcriptional MerR regulator/predicted RNase H-like HicB family nuclease